MKNTRTNGAKRNSLLAIALIAVIGFSFIACSDDGGGTGGGGGGGKSWKAVPNSPFDGIESGVLGEGIYTVTYGNGKFVAGGEGWDSDNKSYGGKIATSPDGVTWTIQTNHPFYKDRSNRPISQIVYGNGKFIAVGGAGTVGSSFSNKMAYSSDGITWTAVADTGLNSGINVAYGNGKFVAFANSKMAYSSDGITWTALDSPFKNSYYPGNIDKIAFGNNKFYAWVNPAIVVHPLHTVSTSTDGVTWTAETETDLGNYFSTYLGLSMRAIAYGNGKFVVGISDGQMATSSDGITWPFVPKANNPFYSVNGSTRINEIAYGNGRFFAGGDNGLMAASTDGVTWTADTGWTDVTGDILGTSKIYAIAYGNGKFIAVGSRGHMAYWN
jgi:hypothetical protein